MMKSGNRIYRNWLYAVLLIVFSSCIDETFTENPVEGTFLTVRGITPLGATTHEGTPEDRVVRTLRILAFDRTTGNKISNVYYTASTGDIIRHPIDPGTYDFVFLANEPPHIPVKTKLEAISNYSDLDHIAYPASFFFIGTSHSDDAGDKEGNRTFRWAGSHIGKWYDSVHATIGFGATWSEGRC